ncbi:MAG: hypothetical protein CUN56_01785 [Phototrophicales bacterium]|nr:MAG: hypothetical protein CUN56_01785 [Phototrophicales bacterium]RMG69941.1 MAG: TVP38/TMEM64 family protein [Chloroflexota bacterium]
MIWRVRLWVQQRIFQIIAVFFWLGMITAMYTYIEANNLTLAQVIEQMETTMRENWYGVLIFLFVMIVLRPFTLIPALVLAALGGRVFGLWWGFLWGMLGATISAIGPYYFGWLFATRDVPETTFTTPGVRRMMHKAARFMYRNAFASLLALRLINAPYDIVSFVAGNLKLPFRIFLLATFLGNISSIYGFTALGAAVEGDITEQNFSLNAELVFSSVVVLLLSAGFAWLLRRRQRALERAEREKIMG